MICLVAATFECEVEGGPLIPGIVSMAVKGNSNNTWSIQSNGEFAGEGTVQKEVFQEGEEIRRGGGRSAWPGRSVSTTKDHLNHSIISIISPACCEIDGVEHGFDGASGKISRARLGLVFCGRL